MRTSSKLMKSFLECEQIPQQTEAYPTSLYSADLGALCLRVEEHGRNVTVGQRLSQEISIVTHQVFMLLWVMSGGVASLVTLSFFFKKSLVLPRHFMHFLCLQYKYHIKSKVFAVKLHLQLQPGRCVLCACAASESLHCFLGGWFVPT